MLIGTHHYANPGADTFNIEADDVLAPDRQQEIAEISARLQSWRPDLILVEVQRQHQDRLDEGYAAWREGESRDNRNEVYQLGARTAAALGHERIYAVDRRYQFGSEEQGALDLETDQRLQTILTEMEAYGAEGVETDQQLLQDSTLGAYLHHLNTKQDLTKNSEFYHRFLIRGWQDDNEGAAHTVGNWYLRNILIYQNILRVIEESIAERSHEVPLRVLVIFGQGHVPVLHELMEASPYLVTSDAESFLAVFEGDVRPRD